MVDALRDCELVKEDESTLDAAWAAYLATFGPSEPVAAPDEPDETRWKFKAGRLTYNSTVGDWASRSKDTLGALFTRLVAFIKSALSSHVTCTRAPPIVLTKRHVGEGARRPAGGRPAF